MTNNALQKIKNLLSTINNEDITTRKQLELNQPLYASTFYCLEQYINSYVLLSKTHKNKKGDIVVGNHEKIRFITENSSYDKEDIEMAALIKVVEKLNKVFSKPVDTQPWYIYTICSNLVNDYLRNIDLGMVWLDAEITGYTDSSNKSSTYGEMLPDDTYNGESRFIEKETIKELTEQLNAKKAKQLNKKQNEIFFAIHHLSSKPAEVFANLSVHLNMKNKEFTNLLIERGAVEACEYILQEISKQFEISKIDELIKANSVSDKLFKVDSENPTLIADQISKLRNRGKNRLKTYNEKNFHIEPKNK